MTTFCLIERIHDEGSVRSHVVRVETRTAQLNRAAVHPLAAHIVYIGLQRLVARLWLRHAPLLPGLGWRRRWWLFWSRLQYTVSGIRFLFSYKIPLLTSHIPTVGFLIHLHNKHQPNYELRALEKSLSRVAHIENNSRHLLLYYVFCIFSYVFHYY